MSDEPSPSIFQDDSGGIVNFKASIDYAPRFVQLADETGQVWALSVRPDGQLQTAKWPDGEPIRFTREQPVEAPKANTVSIRDVVAEEVRTALKSLLDDFAESN